jgi:hypothetical protein
VEHLLTTKGGIVRKLVVLAIATLTLLATVGPANAAQKSKATKACTQAITLAEEMRDTFQEYTEAIETAVGLLRANPSLASTVVTGYDAQAPEITSQAEELNERFTAAAKKCRAGK